MTSRIDEVTAQRLWWAASDSARELWDARTRSMSKEEALSELERELRRQLTEDLGRSQASATGLIATCPDWIEQREWFLNMIAFFSARSATGQ